MLRWPFALALGGVAACSLMTDLDGFTSPPKITAGAPHDAGKTPPDAKVPADARPRDDAAALCGDVTSDPHNCGQCGKDCLGGTCTAGKCGVAILSKGLNRPLGIGLSQGKLYVGTQTSLVEVSLDGKDVKTVVPDVHPLYLWGTDTDVFFTNDNDASLRRWPHSTDGSNSVVLGSQPHASGITLSPTHVYYTRYQPAAEGGGVYRVTYPTVGDPEKLKDWNNPECVAWADGKTYFAGDGQDTAELLHDDGSVDELLSGGGPTGISVIGDDAFITRQGAGELVHVSLSTKASDVLARGLSFPSGIVATATAIYFVELNAGTIDVVVR